MISLTWVMSRFVLISWQAMHPMAMAECTDLPLVLSSWHWRHVEGSALGSSVTGCLAAETRPTQMKTNIEHTSTSSQRFGHTIDFRDLRATSPPHHDSLSTRIALFFNPDYFCKLTLNILEHSQLTHPGELLNGTPTVASFIILAVYRPVQCSK